MNKIPSIECFDSVGVVEDLAGVRILSSEDQEKAFHCMMIVSSEDTISIECRISFYNTSTRLSLQKLRAEFVRKVLN